MACAKENVALYRAVASKIAWTAIKRMIEIFYDFHNFSEPDLCLIPVIMLQTCFQFLFPNLQNYSYLDMHVPALVEDTKFDTIHYAMM